jgi:hypothetical protein
MGRGAESPGAHPATTPLGGPPRPLLDTPGRSMVMRANRAFLHGLIETEAGTGSSPRASRIYPRGRITPMSVVEEEPASDELSIGETRSNAKAQENAPVPSADSSLFARSEGSQHVFSPRIHHEAATASPKAAEGR